MRSRFAVRDTGIGIAADDAGAHLRRNSSRPTAARPENSAAPAWAWRSRKRIVERMGGTIAVESTPGAGATFRVSVPLPRAPAIPTSRASPLPDLAGHDVLIVAPGGDRGVADRAAAAALGRANAPSCPTMRSLPPSCRSGRGAPCWSTTRSGTAQSEVLARLAATVPRRIVLVTPASATELPALKEAGFTGYLIKPVRAASLAARFSADDAFEPAAPEPKEAAVKRSAARTAACRSWSPRTTRSTRCSRARC